MRKIVLLGLLGVSLANAQFQTTPITPEVIDYITPITKIIDNLVASQTGLFLTEAIIVARAWLGISLGLAAAKFLFGAMSRHFDHLPWEMLSAWVGRAMLVFVLLNFYNAPIYHTTVSGFLPDAMRWFAGKIELHQINTLAAQIGSIVYQTESPSIWDPAMVGVYFQIEMLAQVIQALLFGVNIIAFLGIGIFRLVGPLFICCYAFKWTERFFWGWVTGLIKWSFYRVVAAALTLIWATTLVAYFNHSIHGDYSLENMSKLVIAMVGLSLAVLWSVFQVRTWVNDLFSGGADAGVWASSVASSVTRRIR